MRVGLNLGLAFMTRKFARLCFMCFERHNVVQVKPLFCGLRSCASNPDDSSRDSRSSDASVTPASTSPSFSHRASLFGRRRPLSPLERVSQLLPEDTLSQEVWDLRESRNSEAERLESITENDVEQNCHREKFEASSHEQAHACVSGERPICFGEYLLAEYRRNRRVEFRKMFQLKEGLKIHSNWGLIAHEDIEGRPAGSILCSSMGIPILIRRPSLEEFTLFMKRGPAIAYPKVKNNPITTRLRMCADVS